MSTPVANTKSAAEEQVPKAEEKQETSTTSEDVQVKDEEEATTEPSTTAEPTAKEVDSSFDETEPEAASGEEANPAEGETSEDAKAADDNKNRRNGATRKRYKWLLEQGYSPEEAASKAKEPLKVQELEEFKSLSGAAKKRYNYFLKNGCGDKEALTLAREPMGATPKRNLSANSGTTNQVSKAPSDPAGGMVMAVAVMDYPNTSFTKAQGNEFKSAILREVIAQKDSDLKPHFESCTYVKGYLRVHCSDEDTRRWLQRVVSKLAVPEGMASLKIIAEKNLLKGDIYTGFFPDSRTDNNEAILEFVESQNESIDTSKWKILSRKEVQNKQTVELTFTMDQASAKSIYSLGFELNYKFNKIKIRKQHKSGNTPAHANPNMRLVGNMGPPQVRRPYIQQGQPANLNVWDNNYGQNRVGNSFNRFDNSRNSFGSSTGGFGWSNGGNSFGLGSGGGGVGGNTSSSFGGSNSFGGGNNPFANAIAMAGTRGGYQSNTERSFNNLIESLYDQLKIIGNTTSNSGNNSNNNSNYNGNNFGAVRRPGSGDGNDNSANSNNNQWGRNTGNNSGTSSSYPNRTNNYYGNRSFYTTTRTGFF